MNLLMSPLMAQAYMQEVLTSNAMKSKKVIIYGAVPALRLQWSSAGGLKVQKQYRCKAYEASTAIDRLALMIHKRATVGYTAMSS